MILSEETIKRKVEDGEIDIEPEPRESQFQPASLDVRIGNQLYDIDEDREYNFVDEILVKPKTPYLGHTIDDIRLPNNVCAQLTGRSTLARKGIMPHWVAGFIDPGFSGEITLELYNFTRSTVRFDIGDRIAQLVFFKLDKNSEGYSGQYQNQKGITEAGSIGEKD